MLYIFILYQYRYNQIMITLDFSQRGRASLTEFIYHQLKERILAGFFQPDQRLPSKRSLASHLGVSVITVQNAYQQLIDEGYVYSAEKRGYFVTPLELPLQAIPRSVPPTVDKESPQRESADDSAIPTIGQSQKTINLKDSHIHQELFPFSLWSSLMRKVLQDSKERILSPLPPEGLRELRLAIASYLGTFRNMDVEPEQVVIGAGTEYLYSLALQLFGRRRYGVENPGYLKPSQIMEAMGVAWTPVNMDSAGINVQELEAQQVDVALVSPAHQFPSGTIMPIRRRQELLAWSQGGHQNQRERFLIEDDYDSEFRFTGRPLETLFSLDAGQISGKQGHVIYLNTFTKTLTPSLRISYMVLPWTLVDRFRRQLGFYSCTVSSIEQLTLARFIREGHYEKHLARRKNHYRNVRDSLLLQLSRSPIASRISISGKDTGLHFLMELDTTLPHSQVQRLLEEAGIQVSFLHQYVHGEQSYQHVHDEQPCFPHRRPSLVVNYSALKKEQIPILVERLCRALAGSERDLRS